VITCSKCSKENQDHYKFCLGCGAELPRDAAPKPFSPQTPAHGMKAAKPAAAPAAAPAPVPPPAAAPFAPAPSPAPVAPAHAPAAPAAPAPVAPAPAAPAGTVSCPQCGHMNAPHNIFCGSCGFRLGGAPPKVAPAPAPVAAGPGGPMGVTLTALRADGSEAGTFIVPSNPCVVGRDTGGIFAGDSYLSPRHATIRKDEHGRIWVKDEGSLNGVYRKLTRDIPVELRPNDVFRIGQEIVKFESIAPLPPTADGVERLGAPSKGYVGRIALVIGRETSGNAFPVPETGLHLGRERGDVLFPEDGYVSGLHCHIAWDGARVTLTDLGSSNGTFLRIREEMEVVPGDILLMGQQLFRISA
jgi:pSer/pThr/pTyr-binding forkhead associated (FHA) protein